MGRRDILSQKANISNMDFCNFNPLNSRPLRPTICLLNTARLPCKKPLFPALAARLGILHHVNIFTSCACAEQRTPLCRLQPCSCTSDRMETMIVDLRGIYSSARPSHRLLRRHRGRTFTAKLQPWERRHFGSDVVFSFCRAEKRKDTH